MPDTTISQGHIRSFTQRGGPRPDNRVRYAGQDEQYLAINGLSNPVRGGVTPIRVPDPNRPKQFINVGETAEPGDFGAVTVLMREMHGKLPLAHGDMRCAFNIYAAVGKCKNLSDFNAGWSDFVRIISGILVNDRDHGDITGWDSDDPVETSMSATIADHYSVGGMGFGDNAAALIDREVIDVVYGKDSQCGECGAANDGTKFIYAITKASGAGSPGLPAELVYSINGGATWIEAAITGIGANEDPIAVDIAGDKLVILSRTAGSATLGGYYYATIDSDTGIPGAFTKVTSGFVANRQPNDIYVISPREIFFAADGGYIYKAEDIATGVSAVNAGSATTNNLLRIHGDKGETIVATGAASTVIVSTNRGATFATTNANPSGVAADVAAVAVLSDKLIWVGLANIGRVFYTLDGGKTWTEQPFDNSGAGSVRDIVFATPEVGYFSHDTTTPTGRVFATWNGGANWTREAPRIRNLPTMNRGTRLAVPTAGVSQTNANNLLVAGLAGNGTDGILLRGVTPQM